MFKCTLTSVFIGTLSATSRRCETCGGHAATGPVHFSTSEVKSVTFFDRDASPVRRHAFDRRWHFARQASRRDPASAPRPLITEACPSPPESGTGRGCQASKTGGRTLRMSLVFMRDGKTPWYNGWRTSAPWFQARSKREMAIHALASANKEKGDRRLAAASCGGTWPWWLAASPLFVASENGLHS
jgi:hypothetical protein